MHTVAANGRDAALEHPMARLAGKYLTFALGPEEYGLPVRSVREIIKVMDITAVPQVPSHIRGVVNLRGKVVPVVDLRRKFGLEGQADTDRGCIVVVEVIVAGATTLMGVVVDSVSEVLQVAATDIEPMPQLGGAVTTDYIMGLAKTKGAVKILLDLDRVLDADGQVTRSLLQ